MLERLEQEFKNWLKKLENLLIEMKDRKITSSFFDKKAQKIIDDYWEILQLVYEQDVLGEMKKQGYDPEVEIEVPKKVWDIIKPKLIPVLSFISKDAKDLLTAYIEQIKGLDMEIRKDLELISTTDINDALIIFNTTLREK